MPKLKDYLQSDLDVFMNVDEFATNHSINGTEMDVIVDNDLIEQWGKNRQTGFKDPTGIYNADMMFIVKAADFGDKPLPGENIRFDGDLYQVADAKEETGSYLIGLVANFS
jgi:hypothetical protein